jgi:hypothetical protein
VSDQRVTDSLRPTHFDELVVEWYSTTGRPTWEEEFARLTDEWRAVEWRSGGSTLLAALGLQYQEVPLCRGLAWLLDPEGGHNFGRHFLDAFLRSLDLPTTENAPVRIRVEESRVDTRADIVIRAGEQTVVVEAKVLAGEQPVQADRLFEHWGHETPCFVFLTRSGRVPETAEKSVGLWTPRTWRELAQLARATAETAALEPSSGAREFIETIGVL